MNFYDQDDQNRSNRKKGNKFGYFLASLAGLIVGALLIIIAIPQLANYGLLPGGIFSNNDSYGTNETNVQNGTKGITSKVSVDVSSQVTAAVDKVAAAVVGVTNIQETGFWGGKDSQEAGTGSGVIYKKSGNKAFVVTNHHVVEGANKLEVTLSDGTKESAKLLGSDIWTDLAILEIDSKNVKIVADFGNSDNLKTGEPAIAIGNPLGATFSGSVTQGIISGLERTIPVDINQDGAEDWHAEVLQTDAAINPGNSGGALVNIKGQLIGINSMKIAEQEVEGIGLAIPINSAQPIINDLEQHGEVKRPFMGVELESVSSIAKYYQEEALKLPKDIKTGVAIRKVQSKSPADQAGIKVLDVIVEMDGEKIEDVVDLRKHLYTKKKIGDNMKIKFYRDGKLQETTLKLTGGSI